MTLTISSISEIRTYFKNDYFKSVIIPNNNVLNIQVRRKYWFRFYFYANTIIKYSVFYNIKKYLGNLWIEVKGD